MNRTIAGGDESDDLRNKIIAEFHRDRESPDFSIAEFWGVHGPGQTTTLLSSLIKIDMQLRFDRGDAATAEEYLADFPELTADADRALSLIYEEFCLLEEHRHEPSVGDFILRYQPWGDSLASQLNYHREFSQIVGSDRPKVRYPAVGDRFASYELRSILGKGGAAQVYLATDDLGGRQVVLKVSPSIGLEPSILASLEHRNIVSIFTVVESPELGLRGICMPYKTGITLEALLADLTAGSLPRKARSIWQRLEIDQADPDLVDQGWKDFPTRGTYTEAVAWIGLMVSNALAYLHRKGIFHRDIKPANILLTHSEGPLLFDFNLAHCPNAPEHARDALNGGTLPYMAPEQLRAFLDPAAWARVGGPADIYALGLILRELVTGTKPDVPNRALPLGRAIQDLHDRRHDLSSPTRLIRPDLPPALDAIIGKCLSFRPEDRYATAKEVGEDLRRFLERKPLLVARNDSSLELVANWAYRRRRTITGVGLSIFVCGLLLATRQAGPKPSADRPPEDAGFAANSSATRGRFLAGIDLLDSPGRASWREAEAIFDDIARTEPGTAWPLVYRSLSLRKLDPVNTRTAEELIKTASQKPDFRDAILHRCRFEPNQIPLLLSLGQSYLDKRQIRSARWVADEALRIAPTNAIVLVFRGNVILQEKGRAAGIDAYLMAGKTIAALEPTSPAIGLLNDALVPLLIGAIDDLLASKPKAVALPQLKQWLDQLDQQLVTLEARSGQAAAEQPALWTKLNLAIGRANLQSGRGYLYASQGSVADAVENFDKARESFGLASIIAEDQIKVSNAYETGLLKRDRDHIRKARESLKQRMEQFSLSGTATRGAF